MLIIKVYQKLNKNKKEFFIRCRNNKYKYKLWGVVMYNFSKKQQYAIIILLCFGLLFSGYIIYQRYNSANDAIVQSKNIQNTRLKTMQSNTDKKINNKEVKVYVTGLVKSPGVYSMNDGDRIIDALNKAGGPLEGADLTNINLAEKVKDEQMIKIVKKGEESTNIGNNGQPAQSSQSSKININTATKEQLDTLPGIGEVTAQRIVDYREQHGKFQKIEDIMNVSRIGPKLFEQIKDKITAD